MLGMLILFSALGLAAISDANKNSASTKEMKPVDPVMALFTLHTQDLCVFLNASTSQGDIVSYQWHLGDGETALGAVVAHCYFRSGKYQINLTVENKQQMTESQGLLVTVSKFNQSPDAVFTYMDQGSNVYFDAGESKDDGAISSYLWDFGDGTMGSGKKISHEFGANGNYEVVLTVTDNNGKSALQRSVVGVFKPISNQSASLSQ